MKILWVCFLCVSVAILAHCIKCKVLRCVKLLGGGNIRLDIPIICARDLHKHIGCRKRWLFCFAGCVSGAGVILYILCNQHSCVLFLAC